jgi:hypothetical protein
MKSYTLLSTLVLLTACSTPDQKESKLYHQVSRLSSIEGKTQYLASPFVTAGDRVYLVGYQNGSFPELGWHINGEMGGLWDHPIKLMDGFIAKLAIAGNTDSFCLDDATRFVNYPLGNSHHFEWSKENIIVERFQFVPDGIEGVIIEFRIINQGKKDKEIEFSFTGMTDLRPTWLGERTNMIDSEDEISFDEKLSAVIAKDKNNPWYTAVGSSLEAKHFSEDSISCGPISRKGLGKNATLSFPISLKSNQEKTISVFIAGSYQSEESLRSTYAKLKTESASLLQQKIDRYKKINASAHLNIPDKSIEQMYEWLKYNVDWLTRNVPEQGIGISAGLPDYPWWFGADAAYVLQGALATGHHELAKNTIILLNQLSQKVNGNGRILHEVSTNGSVYNPGNVNETAQFITLVLHYYQWTGDKELVSQLFPNVKKGINWLLKEMDPDGNGYPNGSGMMEIPGLDSEMIDVAVYTQQGLASAAELARALGEQATAATYQTLADELKVKINREWWQPRAHSFGDFRGTVAEARPILEAALIRSDTLHKPWAVAELKETKKQMKAYSPAERVPHVIYHNWVVNTPMETGVAEMEKGQAALEKARTYENLFGAYVTGIDRTEEPDSVVLKSRKKIFSYTGAVMTLPTGVLAVGAARYGKPEDALRYIEKLNQSFSYALPGSMYEVSPDFGMFTQAWNIYGVAVPIIQHFFGIQPKAYEKTISISPHMPERWKEASIENVRVGDNSLSLDILQKDDHKEYRITQTKPDWTLIIDVAKTKKILVNDKVVERKSLSGDKLMLQGEKVSIQIY